MAGTQSVGRCQQELALMVVVAANASLIERLVVPSADIAGGWSLGVDVSLAHGGRVGAGYLCG